MTARVPSTSRLPGVPLREGTGIPQLGLGLLDVSNEAAVAVTRDGLRAGFRHLDTAAGYRNEEGVGGGIRASGLDRADVFVTTKCPNEDHGFHEAQLSLEGSLARLGLDYVDLYLIHWPIPAQGRYVETWRGLIELRRRGLCLAIGVSNFLPAHVGRLIRETGVTPAVNQIELHPYFQQTALCDEHARLGIVTEAWSPLARARVLRDPELVSIAKRLDRTPAQVVLRWHLQAGRVVIPKAARAEHMRQNLAIGDFNLEESDMARIDSLDAGLRTGPSPETFPQS